MNGSEQQRRYKVLHVDDFDEFLDEFREVFSQWLEITSAGGGEDALATLAREHFDAVVVDYEMPDLDGLEFMARAQEQWPSLPVIFCTGQGSEEVARRAFTAGASDYFIKDFSLFAGREKLVNSIRQAVEKREIEESLQQERVLLASIIDHNPYSIEIFDADGHIVRWNQAALDLFKAIPGPEYNGLEDPNLLQAGYGPLFDRVKGGEATRFPVVPYNARWVGPQYPDHLVHIAGVAFPLQDPHGDFQKMVVMHEDVTARVVAEEGLKQAHVALQESHDQLEHRVEERTAALAEANQALQREIQARERLQKELVLKNRELEDFSFRVGHDLKNSLLGIHRVLEFSRTQPALVQENADQVLEHSAHLIDFVERLLQMARAGRVIGRRCPTDLSALVSAAFGRVLPTGPASEGTGAELKVHGPLPSVVADPAAMDQVFTNLVRNSLQHRDPERPLRLELSARADGEQVEIRFRDNGRGIAPDHLDRIFGMGFTTDESEHLGFGLPIVRKIIEAHGGLIRAQSDGPGQGTTFVMELPQRS